jgi:hypothetical protein
LARALPKRAGQAACAIGGRPTIVALSPFSSLVFPIVAGAAIPARATPRIPFTVAVAITVVA